MELTEECRENRRFGRWMVTAANGSYYRCRISAHGEPFLFSLVAAKYFQHVLIVSTQRHTYTHTHTLFLMHHFQRTTAPSFSIEPSVIFILRPVDHSNAVCSLRYCLSFITLQESFAARTSKLFQLISDMLSTQHSRAFSQTR